jgi:inactivated superfamily I helicase
VGVEARSLVGEAEEERRRNLAHNAKVLRLFAELAAKNDSDYWRAYLNFINDFYRYVWRRLEEDPLFRETYMKILAERAKRPRREPPEEQVAAEKSPASAPS